MRVLILAFNILSRTFSIRGWNTKRRRILWNKCTNFSWTHLTEKWFKSQIFQLLKFLIEDDFMNYFLKSFNIIVLYKPKEVVYIVWRWERILIFIFSYSLLRIQVLSMSKMNMKVIICPAKDLELQTYYQDTDSMQIR